MRYIIIGGAGFLGYHLIERLKKNNENIVVIDVKKPKGTKVEFHIINITNKAELQTFMFRPDDIVIHLAANQYHEKVPRQGRNEYFFAVNFNGTQNILEQMNQQGCKNLIFFSTDMTYGKPQYLPVDINHPQVPFGPYGRSKKQAEGLCCEYRNKGFQITIFRPRMILGPGRLGILVKLFKLMDMGFPVPMIGTGKNCYQMVSVEDCVTAILLAIKANIPNKAYNLGSNNPPTVYRLLSDFIVHTGSHSILVKTNGEFVKTCLKVLGLLRIELLYKEQYEIADENYIVDISETQKDLGWNPKDSDKDMLLDAYKFYESIR